MQKKVKKRLLTGGILVVTTAVLSPALFWGYIMASMYWTLHVDVEPPEPWDGCVDPTSAAELAGWINTSEATGEPLCDPEIVNMTFPEDTEEASAPDPLPQ